MSALTSTSRPLPASRSLATARSGTYGQVAGLRHRGEGAAQPQRARLPREALVTRAYDLSRGADTDAQDSDSEMALIFNDEDMHFHQETSTLVLKVLTMRAVKQLLSQLESTSRAKQRYLADFCEVHSPLKGDEFVTELFNQKCHSVTDGMTGKSTYVSPSDLAQRLLVVRKALAQVMATPGFNAFVSRSNVGLMRTHLEAHTYTSGSVEEPRRPKKAPKGRGGSTSAPFSILPLHRPGSSA